MGKQPQEGNTTIEPLEEIQVDVIEPEAAEDTGEVKESPEETTADAPDDRQINDDENEFSGLDDKDMPDITASTDDPTGAVTESSPPEPDAENSPDKQPPHPKKTDAADKKTDDEKTDSEKSESDKTPGPAKIKSRLNYVIAGVVGALTIAGYIMYSRPSVIAVQRLDPPAASTIAPASDIAPHPKKSRPRPILSDKQQKLIATVDEATSLRNALLKKKEEIYQLKLYYRHGIAELQTWIDEKMQKEGATNFDQAVANKKIELNLRTIRRRQAYIVELEKPYRWIDRGSEELLFLIRKARFDLLMLNAADGIDLDRHRRYLNAAVSKYQPTAEKLAVDPPAGNLESLKATWNRIRREKSAVGSSLVNIQDQEITEEICSGRYQRPSQLTKISARAARCLSRMKGPALVLNDVSMLPASAAEHLFKWRGDWICLNGLKTLSPDSARCLFQWQGSWISLNGLTTFSPELARCLLKWNGQQLELMGLKPDKTISGQKVLKYLALWETSGGKLFVSDTVRKEMQRGMN